MSRSALPLRSGPVGGSRAHGILRWWHAACLFCAPSLTGCPFVLDFIEVEQNVPPEIINSSPGEGEDLVFATSEYKAFVIVRDDTVDQLDFFWTIEPDLGIQPNAVPVPGGENMASQLTLTRDEALNGKELVVTVYDPQGATAERAWTIVVPEVDQ